MNYVELTIEEAMEKCNKNAKVLVAVQDLKQDDVNVIFVKKEKKDYEKIFEDVQTAASLCDEFVKQVRLFTAKQDIYNIRPEGLQKIILLRE